MRVPTPLALLLSATLLAGCSGDDDDNAVDELRSALADREQAEAALVERVEDLEERLDGKEKDEPIDAEALEELDERLNALSGSVSGVESDLAAERSTREEIAEEVEATAGDLRSTLSELRGEIDELRGELEDLRVRYQILQERVDESSE